MMKPAYHLKIFFIILSFYSSLLQAKPLYIEISGGQNFGIPIAVLPFTIQESHPLTIQPLFSKVISHDLLRSGQFQPYPNDDIQELTNQVVELDYAHWRGEGIEKLVLGNLKPLPNGNYDVSFQLIDIYSTQRVLADVNFYNESPERFRALAHHISDLIFKKLIGVPGVASTRIAYITVDKYAEESIHRLVIADADGHNDETLLVSKFPIMSPAWSPDGSKIAFVSFEDNKSTIKVAHLSSGKIQTITRQPGINGSPAWSPDGKSLAVVLSKDGAPKIYITKLNWKRLKQLTFGGGIDTEPCWDPDGKSIVFTSSRGGGPNIYRIAIDSKKVKRLTYEGSYNATPSVTPDGKNLVMMHRGKDGHFNIAVQNLSTNKIKILTNNFHNESPSLAPNGMMVIYAIRDGAKQFLGEVSIDGKFQMKLPAKEGGVKHPAWSPFLS